MQRIALFDLARGMAILLMVFAHSMPLMGEDYLAPFGLRVLCSIPAPLFVILSGMIVAQSASLKNVEYYIKRSAILIIIAAGINIFIHHSPSFRNIDILYLLGASIPINYFINFLKTKTIILFCLFNFILTHVLQFYFPLNLTVLHAYPTWQLWLVSGWFPLLPWVAMMSVGLLFYRAYHDDILFKSQSIQKIMTTLFLLGFLFFYFIPIRALSPGGFQELFYPPSLGFICMSLPITWTVFFLLHTLHQRLSSYPLLSFIRLLGKNSLFIYILHVALVFRFIFPFFYPLNSAYALYLLFFIYIIQIFFLFSLAYFIEKIRKKFLYI